MIDLAESFDVDWMSGKSIGLFPLRNASPDPVARELEAVFADATGDVPSAFIRFLPVGRLSAIMVIASEPSQLVEAQAWIDRLDKGNQSERTLRVYYVKNGKATDIANTLSRVFGSVSATAADPTRRDQRQRRSRPDAETALWAPMVGQTPMRRADYAELSGEGSGRSADGSGRRQRHVGRVAG